MTEPFSIFGAFELPKDQAYMDGLYWTPARAAKEWHCSRATAYRLIERYGSQLGRTMIWVVMPGKTELKMVIKAGSEKPKPPKGNPAFRDSLLQSGYARAREARKRAKRR